MSLSRRAFLKRGALFTALALNGCQVLDWLPGQQPSPAVKTPVAITPTVGATPTLTPTPEPLLPQTLTLWAPPEFDPNSGTPAGDLLNQRLKVFSQENDNVQITVRLKTAAGPAGLLESLAAASAAASLAQPSIVVLNRPDLETAALKGLLVPLDSTTTILDQSDWYEYARQLAMVQGVVYGLPFAGDALVTLYRADRVLTPPDDWDSVLRLSQPLAFPVSDNQGLVTLAFYMAAGGQVEDAQRRPFLQNDVLARVLQYYADGEQRAIFPPWLAQYETDAQLWQGFNDQRYNAIFSWLSMHLADSASPLAIAPMPAMDDHATALASGWAWAVSDPLPERREFSIRLTEYLSDAKFLAEWSEAAGFLPTRPAALAAWRNQSLKSTLSPIAVTAQARPSGDVVAVLGPLLKEAVLKVLKREADPTAAANAAAEKIVTP